MPAFNFKSSEGFDWGAFPPVSPEAENWQPDPDSIAKPGAIPDARFNRDPYEENRKAAYKKENKVYSIPADVAASMISTSSSPALQGVNGWPAPEIRASGLPRALVNANNMSVNSVTSATTILPSTSSSVSTPTVKTQNAALAAKSIPPHLRKKAQLETRLDPAAKSYFPVQMAKTAIVKGDHEDTAGDEELALKLATVELGVDDAEEGLQLQKDMMEDHSVNPSKSPETTAPADANPQPYRQQGNHGHWLKTRLVIIMEDDLDLNNRATKRELMAMSANDIDQYLLKVASAHENWWEAEQRLYTHNTNVSE